jgi:hypothetical protein
VRKRERRGSEGWGRDSKGKRTWIVSYERLCKGQYSKGVKAATERSEGYGAAWGGWGIKDNNEGKEIKRTSRISDVRTGLWKEVEHTKEAEWCE